jgi:two-component system response regulator HydG
MRQTSEYDHPTHPSLALPAWLVGRSAPLCALARAADDLGHAEVNLLIQGESGTGKCALAETIHARSLRADRSFAVVHLAERTEAEVRNDLFGGAGAGAIVTAPPGATLYLDGVEGLTADLQRRLLLALSSAGAWSRVRIISGANLALEEAVRLGRFRRDLFFRLGVLRISIPPLRERREDIPLIVEALVAARGAVTGRVPVVLDRGIVNELCADVWPGNARELDRMIDRLFEAAHGGAPRIEHLRAVLGRRPREQPMPDVFPLRELERDYIQAVLISCNWNQSLAARRLGIGRNTLLRKIKAFGFGKAEAA